MRYLKTYEDKSKRELEREHNEKISNIDFDDLTRKYKNNFFIWRREYNYMDQDFFIVLVEKIEPHNSIYPIDHIYAPKGDNFTVLKNGEITNPGGWGMSETEEGFNKIHFMTAIEFYTEHKELCEKLFLFVMDELFNKKYGEWYGKTLKWYRNVLETIPDLQYFYKANKFNL